MDDLINKKLKKEKEILERQVRKIKISQEKIAEMAEHLFAKKVKVNTSQ